MAKTESKYITNFVKTKKGNGIKSGTVLLVRVKGAESVTAQIRDPKNGIVEVDQSYEHDEDNDAETVNLLLKRKVGRRFWMGSRTEDLPVGKYTLVIWYWDNDTMRGGTYTDEFEVY